MINFNGMSFAKTEKEFAQALVDNQTPSGYYRARKHGVLLMDVQKLPVAFLKFSGCGGFVVTASRQSDNKIWYSFSTTATTEQLLQLTDLSRSAISDQVESVQDQLSALRGDSAPKALAS